MLKQSIITIPLFLTLGCGPDTIVVIPQHSEEFPVPELEYIEASSESETEQLLYAERIIFEDEHAPEEEPIEEEQPEEEPIEEEPVQEEEPAEEEPVQEEEPAEEEPVEEEPVQEEAQFSGECNLEGNVYNFNSSCISPQICVSRHQDNFQVIPETGFCAKYCMGHINCPSGVCVINGITPGVGYCEE
jgi:hypothetical protein